MSLNKRYVSLLVSTTLVVLLSVFITNAANPASPFTPSDNVQDPGNPLSVWGGCGPLDSNCYVSVASPQNLSNASLTANGNYTQNWNNKQLVINDISSLVLNVGSGTEIINATSSVLNMGIAGNALLVADATSTMINVAGNTLINASTTGTELTVNGNSLLIGSTTNTDLYVGGNGLLSGGIYTQLYTNGGNDFLTGEASFTRLNVNGESEDYFNIVSGGNVGIGTSSPYRTLSVNGEMNTVTLEVGAFGGDQQFFFEGTSGNASLGDAVGNFNTVYYDLNQTNGHEFRGNFKIRAFNGSDILNMEGGRYFFTTNGFQNFDFSDSLDGGFMFKTPNSAEDSNVARLSILGLMDETRVGIGTTSPTVALDVVGDGKITGDFSTAYAASAAGFRSTATTGISVMGDLLGNYNVSLIQVDDPNNAILLQSITTTISNLSGTGTRTVLADSNGVLSAPVSDRSVKQNIQTLDYGLDTLMQLNPVSFEYIQDWKNYGVGKQIGFIAQDIAQILPNSAFTTPKTGKMGYNEIDLVPVLVKAVQELNLKISPLPVFEDQSLAVKVADFLRGIAQGIANIGKVQTKELCVDDICVTRDQFKAMVENVQQNQVVVPPAPVEPPVVDPVITPEDTESNNNSDIINP